MKWRWLEQFCLWMVVVLVSGLAIQMWVINRQHYAEGFEGRYRAALFECGNSMQNLAHELRRFATESEEMKTQLMSLRGEIEVVRSGVSTLEQTQTKYMTHLNSMIEDALSVRNPLARWRWSIMNRLRIIERDARAGD